jgi:hypothetical protein
VVLQQLAETVVQMTMPRATFTNTTGPNKNQQQYQQIKEGIVGAMDVWLCHNTPA